MTRPQLFIVGSAMIFVLERALPALTNWPLFLFPAFVILFMLTSKNDARDLGYVAVAAIFFDFFSGFIFGFFTLSLLATYLAIYLFKKLIKVEPDSILLLLLYSLVFVFGFMGIISIQSSQSLLLAQWNIILIEAVVVFLLVRFMRFIEQNRIENKISKIKYTY